MSLGILFGVAENYLKIVTFLGIVSNLTAILPKV